MSGDTILPGQLADSIVREVKNRLSDACEYEQMSEEETTAHIPLKQIDKSTENQITDKLSAARTLADLVIVFCLNKQIYDLIEVNALLDYVGCKALREGI